MQRSIQIITYEELMAYLQPAEMKSCIKPFHLQNFIMQCSSSFSFFSVFKYHSMLPKNKLCQDNLSTLLIRQLIFTMERGDPSGLRFGLGIYCPPSYMTILELRERDTSYPPYAQKMSDNKIKVKCFHFVRCCFSH